MAATRDLRDHPGRPGDWDWAGDHLAAGAVLRAAPVRAAPRHRPGAHRAVRRRPRPRAAAWRGGAATVTRRAWWRWGILCAVAVSAVPALLLLGGTLR